MDQAHSLSESLQLKAQVIAGDKTSIWSFTEALRPYLKQVVRSQLRGKLTEKFDESLVLLSQLLCLPLHVMVGLPRKANITTEHVSRGLKQVKDNPK